MKKIDWKFWESLVVITLLAGTAYNAQETHKHTHEAINVCAIASGGYQVFNDNGSRRP